MYKSAKASTSQTLVKYIKRLPTPTVFAAAWGILTDLMLHGLGAYDSQTVADAHSALRHHEFWVLERSKDFTWDSICAYHLAVCAERLASGFGCELWYHNVDADLWTRLQVRKTSFSSLHPSQRPLNPLAPPVKPPARRLEAASSSAGSKATQICNNYNLGTCRGECGRRHVCKTCEIEGHGAGDKVCRGKAQ